MRYQSQSPKAQVKILLPYVHSHPLVAYVVAQTGLIYLPTILIQRRIAVTSWLYSLSERQSPPCGTGQWHVYSELFIMIRLPLQHGYLLSSGLRLQLHHAVR